MKDIDGIYYSVQGKRSSPAVIENLLRKRVSYCPCCVGGHLGKSSLKTRLWVNVRMRVEKVKSVIETNLDYVVYPSHARHGRDTLLWAVIVA